MEHPILGNSTREVPVPCGDSVSLDQLNAFAAEPRSQENRKRPDDTSRLELDSFYPVTGNVGGRE